MKFKLNIKKLKVLYKEIEAIKSDFDDLVYKIHSNASTEEIDKIKDARDKAIERYYKKYNDFNNELDKIEDNTMREIIRLRLKGETYDKIGFEIGYTPSNVYRKEKDFMLNPDKYMEKKEIKAPVKKHKTYPIIEMLKDIEKGL